MSSRDKIKIKPHKKMIRDYSRFSETKFLHDISSVDWKNLVSEHHNQIDRSFSAFYSKFNKIVEAHAPLKPCSIRKARQLTKPWITTGLRKSIKIKNQMFHAGDLGKIQVLQEQNHIAHTAQQKAVL